MMRALIGVSLVFSLAGAATDGSEPDGWEISALAGASTLVFVTRVGLAIAKESQS